MKNVKVVVYSLIALVFVALAYTVHWLFLVGAVVLIYLNQQELTRTKKWKARKINWNKN